MAQREVEETARALQPDDRAAAAPKLRKRALPSGPAAAALLAGGIGAAALGILIVLAETSPVVKTWLTWTAPVGPLSGKTGMAVLAWLLSWAGLHLAWRRQEIALGRALLATYVLVGVGLVLSFPPVFEAFTAK